ncbi:probable WRKY transcription factor 13 isoform X2 [Glycine soja]|uniref:probable WRKY transcription factor 13 isoform X2 n=1 Tax=Glycine soja TaxID=3848 RepID=UPI00103E680A|nr:probable WRKY transcription factor 13 isoform X2 [Glycine soja]
MMSTTSQTNVNHSLFEEQDQIPTQMGLFNIPFPPNQTYPPLGCQTGTLKSISAIAPSLSSATSFSETLLSTAVQRPREDLTSNLLAGGGGQLLSLSRSRVNSWAWEEVSDCLMGKRIGGDDNHHLGVSAMKMKKMKARRKVREPRFCFKTMSDVDVLDDGYKWRKYGQKVVKNTQHPSYYRCTQDNCRVKKRVERLAEDPRMVITTYEGRHVHSPSNELEDSQTPSELSNFLW